MRAPAIIALVFVVPSMLLANAGVRADPPAVDEIIARHIEARGGVARIKALRNLVYRDGKYVEGDYVGPGNATMSLAQPWFKLVGNKDWPGDYMEGYDGAAWEWFADPGIVIRTVGPPSQAIRHYAGTQGPLVDYVEKGSRARIREETVLDGRAVFVIEMTRRDGYLEQFYIDKKTWLIIASGDEAPIHAFGQEVTSLTRIGDYRTVAGVEIPFRFVTVEMPSGRELGSMQWGAVEANLDLPANWFSPPSFERTPLQSLIENLYGQRSDIESVMWTYHEFRRAHPDVDTSDAVNVAGFQTLKMGEAENAIALLEQNAKDYPQSPDARFGLGRAYRTADREPEAREQFRRALKLDPKHKRAQAALASSAYP